MSEVFGVFRALLGRGVEHFHGRGRRAGRCGGRRARRRCGVRGQARRSAAQGARGWCFQLPQGAIGLHRVGPSPVCGTGARVWEGTHSVVE